MARTRALVRREDLMEGKVLALVVGTGQEKRDSHLLSKGNRLVKANIRKVKTVGHLLKARVIVA